MNCRIVPYRSALLLFVASVRLSVFLSQMTKIAPSVPTPMSNHSAAFPVCYTMKGGIPDLQATTFNDACPSVFPMKGQTEVTVKTGNLLTWGHCGVPFVDNWFVCWFHDPEVVCSAEG